MSYKLEASVLRRGGNTAAPHLHSQIILMAPDPATAWPPSPKTLFRGEVMSDEKHPQQSSQRPAAFRAAKEIAFLREAGAGFPKCHNIEVADSVLAVQQYFREKLIALGVLPVQSYAKTIDTPPPRPMFRKCSRQRNSKKPRRFR